MKVNSVFQ